MCHAVWQNKGACTLCGKGEGGCPHLHECRLLRYPPKFRREVRKVLRMGVLWHAGPHPLYNLEPTKTNSVRVLWLGSHAGNRRAWADDRGKQLTHRTTRRSIGSFQKHTRRRDLRTSHVG